MNPQIKHLYEMASRDHRHIIGLMSGTSLDGLDVALCRISGSGRDTQIKILAFDTIDYTEEIKENIRKVFAKDQIDFPYLAMLNEWIGLLHGRMINDFLHQNKIDPKSIDAIASHGQTVMHAPQHQHGNMAFPNATLQIGDGDHIARQTGILTISDFRQKHVAAGGEGAPLAVYGDYLIFSKSGEDRIMLNMGGVANFTFLPGDNDATKVFVTDTGPGNNLMDGYMKVHFNRPFDKDAEVALQGKVNHELLTHLKDHYFFNLPFPKTTGPEVFNTEYVQAGLNKCASNITHEDMMATLNRLSAVTIADAIKTIIGDDVYQVYMSGGGARNPLLVENIQSLLPACSFKFSGELGIPGDAKEAVLFAVLANETLAGSPLDFGNRQGIPDVCMGKISFPN